MLLRPAAPAQRELQLLPTSSPGHLYSVSQGWYSGSTVIEELLESGEGLTRRVALLILSACGLGLEGVKYLLKKRNTIRAHNPAITISCILLFIVTSIPEMKIESIE